MHFLSPQPNFSCSSHYFLFLVKLCWLWHSTHFLSLRGIHLNLRSLIRTSILWGQYPIPCISGWRKDRRTLVWELGDLICFILACNSLSDDNSSPCLSFPICKITGLNLMSCEVDVSLLFFRMCFPCFLTSLDNYCAFLSVVFRSVRGHGILYYF